MYDSTESTKSTESKAASSSADKEKECGRTAPTPLHVPSAMLALSGRIGRCYGTPPQYDSAAVFLSETGDCPQSPSVPVAVDTVRRSDCWPFLPSTQLQPHHQSKVALAVRVSTAAHSEPHKFKTMPIGLGDGGKNECRLSAVDQGRARRARI